MGRSTVACASAAARWSSLTLTRDDVPSSQVSLSWSMIFSENRSPPRIASRAASGAGFFGIMLRFGSDRHALRAPLAHPPGDDQARQGEGGEHGGDDADAEGDRKAAHRAGTDEEQHEGGDEGGDVGIENGGERAGKSRVDRADRRAAG